MACNKNTRSSRINLNHGCNPCNPCDYCNRCACECQCSTPDYCEDGCLTIQPSDCSTYSGENITCVGILKGDTMTEVIQKITAKLCDCCEGETPTCVPLAVTASAIMPTSFRINVTGLALGETWDLSLDNGMTYPYLGITASFKDLTSLAPNTAFIIKVRHNVTGATPCLTTSEVATTSEETPCIPLVVTFSAVGATTARLNIVGLPIGTCYDVSLDGGTTYPYTMECGPFVDLTGLIPMSSYTVKVRIFADAEMPECATIINFQTTPCPQLTFPETYMTYDRVAFFPNVYDPVTGYLPITVTWNPVPGALSYHFVDIQNLIDVVLPAGTTSYSYDASWLQSPGSSSPGILTETYVTVSAELPFLGPCATGTIGFTLEPPVVSCGVINNVTVISTSSNAYGPIFTVGWGCSGCTGVKLYYREFTPGATWIQVGGILPASASQFITPTALETIKFNTMYQFRFVGICQVSNAFSFDVIDEFAISCIGSSLATTGTPSASGVSFTFTEFAANADRYRVNLSGSGDIDFFPTTVGNVRTGTFPGTISSGSHTLSLKLMIYDEIRGGLYEVEHTCPSPITVVI